MGLFGRKTAKTQGGARRSRRLSPNLISLLDPKAPASEAYRTLRNNISYVGIDQKVKTISVTSPGPAEGKSTTCANLAITMAQAGKRVLLMEADLRKPKVHRYFSLPNDVGVTDILVNDIPYESALKGINELPGLHLLCAGFLPPNPSEILDSRKMADLVAQLKQSYDLVIIDTPPAGQLADGASVGKLTDGVLLVLASGQSNIDVARHAKANLENVGARILGVILTKINRKSGGAYYQRYYNYDRYYYENQSEN